MSEAEQNRVEQVRAAVDQHEIGLIGYATSLIRDPERAREIVQETFLRLCRHIDDMPAERLAPWLFKVCRNLCFDTLRKGGREVSLDTDATELVEAPARAEVEDFEAVLAAIERLPANQREVLKLKFLHELSYKEIAEVTELTTSNVGYLIHMGVRAVRRTLCVQPLPVMEVSQ